MWSIKNKALMFHGHKTFHNADEYANVWVRALKYANRGFKTSQSTIDDIHVLMVHSRTNPYGNRSAGGHCLVHHLKFSDSPNRSKLGSARPNNFRFIDI
jgi:hypothetical protein